MKFRKSILLGIIALGVLTGCNGGDTSSEPTISDSEDWGVGDFNFIQQTNVTTPRVNPATSGSNNGTSGTTGSISAGWDTPVEVTTSSIPADAVTEPEELVIESEYIDLSTNYSLQLGEHVWVSIPKIAVENAVDLDTFLENYRQACTLIDESQYGSPETFNKALEKGNLVHLSGSVMYIQTKGITYACKNTVASLSAVKEPSFSLFKLGTLRGPAGGTFSFEYSTLGELVESDETEHYYRAVYTIADVADNEDIQAYAGLIYDKLTGAVSTCVLDVDSRYSESDANILISSLRFTTEEPENLVHFN